MKIVKTTCLAKRMVPIYTLFFMTISIANAQALFQKGVDNWVISGNAKWSFSNGELKAVSTEGGYVITKDIYKNIRLRLDFKPDSTINSGVFVRCKSPQIHPKECYEINIWDLHPNQDFRTGAVVMKSLPLKKVPTIDSWNTLSIDLENDSIKVWVNNILTADFEDCDLKEGYIGLQAFGKGSILFRNIEITSIE